MLSQRVSPSRAPTVHAAVEVKVHLEPVVADARVLVVVRLDLLAAVAGAHLRGQTMRSTPGQRLVKHMAAHGPSG